MVVLSSGPMCYSVPGKMCPRGTIMTQLLLVQPTALLLDLWPALQERTPSGPASQDETT